MYSLHLNSAAPTRIKELDCRWESKVFTLNGTLKFIQNTKSVFLLTKGISKENELIAPSMSSQPIAIIFESYSFCA